MSREPWEIAEERKRRAEEARDSRDAWSILIMLAGLLYVIGHFIVKYW